MTIYYPDVSHWRAGLSLSGAVAVCAKVTENTDYFDDQFKGFKAQAEKLGIFFFSFHFLRHGNAAAQAKWCHDHNGSVPLMLDFEERAGEPLPNVADAVAFIDAYRALGGICFLLYLPHWYWQKIGSPSLRPLIDRGMRLVSSNYTSYSDSGPGWDSYGGMRPVIWQYTDSKSFNGQSVDFNAYKGSLNQLRALATTGKETTSDMTVYRLTETGGWVNGVTHHKTSKHDDGMAVPSGVMGVIMHTMVGYLTGTDSIFMSGPIQSSAHFGIDSSGKIIQWVSIRGGVAWHVADGNYHWYGIEHEDKGHPEIPLTEAQLNASAQLAELLSRDNVGRFPLQVSNKTSTLGYGVHYMGGAAWGGHTCPDNTPGAGPRSKQREEILRRAKIIRATGQYPATASVPAPTARLSWKPDATVPLRINIDCSASTPGSGSITDYQIGWGDGTGQIHRDHPDLYHVYPKPGKYEITLVVYSSNGRSDTARVTVTVPDPAEYISDGTLSLAQISEKLGVAISTLLRRTAVHYGAFDAALGDFISAVFTGTAAFDSRVPAGVRFYKS